MTNQEDYQLESMEDAAVSKTQTAKRVIAGVGLAAAGATATYAATGNAGDNADDDALTAEDLANGAQESVITDEVIEEEVKPTTNHTTSHEPAPVPETTVNNEPDIEVNRTTVIINEDGSTSILDEGHYNNRDFAVLDYDGDGQGDILMYDVNGNGQYESDEMVFIEDGEYVMGQGKDIVLVDDYQVLDGPADETNDGLADNRYTVEKNDIDDIDNDFNKHTGDQYGDDLAHYSNDYNNNGDVEHYSAGHDNAYYDDQYGNEGQASASAEPDANPYAEYDLANAGDGPTDYDSSYGSGDGYGDELAYNEPANDYVEPDYGNDLAYDGSSDTVDLI